MSEHDDIDLGTTVFLRPCAERMPGIVTGILLEPGTRKFRVMYGNRTETWHYAIELTTEYVPNFKDSA